MYFYAQPMRAGIRLVRRLDARARAEQQEIIMQDVGSHPALFYLVLIRRHAGLEDNLQSVGHPEEVPVLQIRQVEWEFHAVVSHHHNPWASEHQQSQQNQYCNQSTATRIIIVSHNQSSFLVVGYAQRVSVASVVKIVSGVNALPASHAMRLRSSSSKRMPLLQVSHLFCPQGTILTMSQ